MNPASLLCAVASAIYFHLGNDLPYRIEWNGDEVESIRLFDPLTQLSQKKISQVSIVPNLAAATGRSGKSFVVCNCCRKMPYAGSATARWCFRAWLICTSAPPTAADMVAESEAATDVAGNFLDAPTLEKELASFSLIDCGAARRQNADERF